MKTITNKLLEEINAVTEGPFVSLYMPTHRNHPENAQDPIRFKNLLKELESSLLQKYQEEEAEELMKPFANLQDDAKFWNTTMDGVAVLAAKNYFEVIDLPITVKEIVVVADSFHTKPLRKFLQSVEFYHVLGVSLHHIKMFIGNRNSLLEMKIRKDVPQTIEEALGDELTDPHLTAGNYGGTGLNATHMYHGHGSKKDEVDLDAERFFRVIADKVGEHYSKPSGLPLILAALPEHHNLFQSVNKNEHLMENGVQINPMELPIEKLKALSWEVMEPAYIARIKEMVETYGQEKAHDKGSDQPSDIAKAAFEGRVESILLEADRVIGGKINPENGNIEKGEIENPEVDDLLDDIGELVTKMGGRVKVIPAEYMPTDSGIAAVYRY
jgi:hypothetical protein